MNFNFPDLSNLRNVRRQTDVRVDIASNSTTPGRKHEYVNREEYQILDQFDSSYWSGLQLDMYAGRVHLPETIQVSYQVVETVKPYWGYASYIPDRMHHGSRIVQGEFSMNMKRFSYIYSLMNTLRSEQNTHLISSDTAVTQSGDGTFFSNPITFSSQAWGPDNATKFATNKLTGDQLAEYVKNKKRSRSLTEGQVNQRAATVPINAGLFEIGERGFDLSIVFGAGIPSPKILRYVGDQDQYYAENGVVEDTSIDPHVVGTGIVLVGVSIMSAPVTINDDGRPIMETYSFMARDVRPMTSREFSRSSADKARAEKLVQEAGGVGHLPIAPLRNG